MATKKPSIVDLMYRDFLRLAGEEVSHAKPAKKKPVVKVVVKKPPAKKVAAVVIKPPSTKKYTGRKTVAVRAPQKPPVVMKPRRSTLTYPIGGVAQIVEHESPPPRKRGSAPVSDHWKYFDRDTGKPVAPWEQELGPDYDDDDDDVDEDEGIFADEDYSYEDLETDWGDYDHSDTGYADENA